MTYSNQELLNRLQAIRLGETDTAKRAADLKMLQHLCAADYLSSNNVGNLNKFLRRANDPKDNFTKFSHEIVDPSSLTSGGDSLPLPTELREKARHKLQLLNIENRIRQIRSDSSAKKEDVEFLQAVWGLSNQEASWATVFKGFEDFQYINRDVTGLIESAQKKIEAIKASQEKKLEECCDKIKRTIETLNDLSANENKPESVNHLIAKIAVLSEGEGYNTFDSAQEQIETALRQNKEAQDKYTTSGYISASTAEFLRWDRIKPKSRRETLENLKKTQKDLEEAKRIVESARRQVDQLRERLNIHQSELQQLRDELNLREIQTGNAEYTLNIIEDGDDFPADTQVRFGYIYCKIDPANSDQVQVKVRSLQNRDQIVVKQYSLADLDAPATSLTNTALEKIREKLKEAKVIYATYDRFYVDQALASVKTTCLRVENIQKDIREATRTLALCQKIDQNPVKPPEELSRRANQMMRVMALSEMRRYDEQGKRYFIEEIVSIDPNTPAIEQPRGLSGHTVYRGVQLNKNEIKRATCETEKGKIIIETSVKKNEKGEDIAMVVDRTVNSQHLTEQDQKLAALQYAAELLVHHKPGDKIVLEGGAEYAKQAEYVYAALLLLTMPDSSNPNDETPPLDPSSIVVKVKSANIPGLRSKAYYVFGNWQQAFGEQTFGHQNDPIWGKIKEIKTQVTVVRSSSVTKGIEPTLDEEIKIPRGP